MRVVTKEEMYAIDRYAMELGLHGDMLMENAGQAVVRRLIDDLAKRDRIIVCIGTGNNGGDGFVIARMLKSYGYKTSVWLIPKKEKIRGDAKKAMEVFERSGYKFHSLPDEGLLAFEASLSNSDVVVDALLGIGIKGALKEPYNKIIQVINKQRSVRVFSVDVPSGLPADGGDVTEAIRADRTFTLQHPKIGAFTYPSREYYGELDVVHIGIPPLATAKRALFRKVWTEEDVVRSFPKRKPSAHKGDHGKGLIIAGSERMSGAAVMAAKAALRSGSGLLTLALPETALVQAASQITEAMFLPCPAHEGQFSGEVPFNHQDFDAICIGPGIGRDDGSRRIVETVLDMEIPLIIDADGLFHLKEMQERLKNRNKPTILTPHAGEMARLLDIPVNHLNQNRFAAAREYACTYGVHLVLKGPFTICTTPAGEQFINPTGNAALAKGGSGDVLTGMILALIMQHETVHEAVNNAVFTHGKAADLLVSEVHSQLDVLATDLIENLPIVYKKIFRSTD